MRIQDIVFNSSKMTIYIFTCILIILCTNLDAYSQLQNNNRERRVIGNIINAVTGESITDTIGVDVMVGDSIIARGKSMLDDRWEYKPGDENKYWFDISINRPETDFTIRLSHPDYATVSFPIKLAGNYTDLGIIQMRKLTKYEKEHTLDEVVIKASVIEVVNKGDTVQYNADAFALAQGSMLDALVELLPGVELKENGQIFVNGRFIDKLLLDGKDFFKGNQFVLLQNLPAYTVKNIKVYELASMSSEVFGKGASSSDPDLFVMDVNLKKGYNTGWLVNAQAGAGSHSRYKGRAFGLAYSKSFRLGAFAFMNNLNEDRNPGRDGNWEPSTDKKGVTTAKAGGIDYGYYKPDRTIEFNGNVSAQYLKTIKNSFSNTQNFLPGGDTYTNKWDDNTTKDLNLRSEQTLTIRPKSGNSYQHQFILTADYANSKLISESVEGTFGKSVGELSGIREDLKNGWIEGVDAINRFITEVESNNKKFHIGLNSFSALSLSGNTQGFRLIAEGNYSRDADHGTNRNDYLLQYAGEKPSEILRSNPKKNHGYDYNLAIDWINIPISNVSISPRLDYFHTYEYKDNKWFTNITNEDEAKVYSEAEYLLPSIRNETLQRLDPNNTYATSRHYSSIRPRIPLYFDKTKRNQDGMPDSKISALLQFDAQIVHDFINFNGIITSKAGKNYFAPYIRAYVSGITSGMKYSYKFEYQLNTLRPDVFNMIDVALDSDPLNIRKGNPRLKKGYSNEFTLSFGSQNYIKNRLWFSVFLRYVVNQGQIAMSYTYDKKNGIKTYLPVNVNGNRNAQIYIRPIIALTKNKNLKLDMYCNILPQRSVDMVSVGDFLSSQKSIVNSLWIRGNASLSYNVQKFMIAAEGTIISQKTTSGDNYFNSIHIKRFNYGARGRVKMPWGVELSTDLKMYSTRGFDAKSMNTNQLVWNARITKSILNGKLLFAIDGYDILNNVSNISYTINEQGRQEIRWNSIPSYVMFSLSWNFHKAPKQ